MTHATPNDTHPAAGPIDARTCLMVIEKDDGLITGMTPFSDSQADEAFTFAQERAQAQEYLPIHTGDMEWADPNDPGYCVFVYDMHGQCCPPMP